ncbi:MAG: pirin family protein [Gammaproteobacteria bacterium]
MNSRFTGLRKASQVKEGDGADVRRLMPVAGFMNFDPFVLWDHFTVKPGAGFPTHPHRGFEAITYMFDGTMRHEDNLGNKSTVAMGGAQRFTAGRGMTHSEMPSEEGESQGIQLWINLPRQLKKIDPDYQQVDTDDFPRFDIHQGSLKVLVGEGSPLKIHTPVRYLDVQLDTGGRLGEDLAAGYRGLVYVVDGDVKINGNQAEQGEGCFLEFPDELDIAAVSKARVMVCIGQPHHEPIRQYGPYVD